jgi:Protein of unknown function (DUF2795)
MERNVMVASTTRRRVHDCLNDVDFPATKDDLLTAAARNGCDEDTARALRAIPPESYANLAEVMASVPLADDRLDDSEKTAARRVHTKPGLAEGSKEIPPNPIAEELGENRKR